MTGRHPDPECPYVGLEPFDTAHADYFFGRTIDSAVLADNVLARRLTVLYGASGVGKSSVLNVGLPRALAELGVAAPIVVRREWHEPGQLAEWLGAAVEAAQATPDRPLILILDQFEEYFLYATAEQVKVFTGLLAALIARTDLEAHLVFAVREDGLHRLDAARIRLTALLDTTLELRHLDEAAVREAIEQPIAVWNSRHTPAVALDPDFAETLVAQLRPKDESGQPLKGGRVELAYLQLALEKIWDAEGGAAATALRTTTLTDRLKGIGEIARRHVEDVLGGLPEEDQALCATVFDRLVTPSGGKILYASTDLATLAKTDAARMDAVLAPLASGKTRLLRAVELPGHTHARGYEILHDTLARPILDWTARRAAQRDAKLERDRVHAEAMAREAKIQAEARQRAEADRARLARLRNWLLGLAVLLAIAVVVAGWAAWDASRQASLAKSAEQRASDSSKRATALRLTAEAQAMLSGARTDGDERAMLQIVAAQQIIRLGGGEKSGEVEGAVLGALLSRPGLRRLATPGDVVEAVAFSPDGRLASGHGDGTLRLWDAQTGQPIDVSFGRHQGWVNSVAFSPDGRRLLSGGNDGMLRLWDAKTGQPVGPKIEGHKLAVNSVAFSPDGRRFVSGSDDQTLRLWDAQTGQQIGTPLERHTGAVNSVAFSPDGRRLVSGSADKTLRLWNAETGEAIGSPLLGHSDAVNSVAVSPDGRRLASGDGKGALRLWDAQTARPVGTPLVGHSKAVNSVAFSRDGRRLVSGSADQTVRLWDAETGDAIGSPLVGHSNAVNSVALSPDGRRLASGGDDQTLRLWDAQAGRSIGVPFGAHKAEVSNVAFSSDRRRLASGSDDGRVRVWDGDTGQPVGVPNERHEGGVRRIAFSPDGRVLVSLGRRDGTLRLWDAQTGQPIGAPIGGPENKISSVAFDPDGRLLVYGTGAGTLRRWNVKAGQPVDPPLEGHTGLVGDVAFSPDGQRLVSGSDDRTLRLWNTQTWQPLRGPLEGHTDSVRSVAFIPDGRVIVSGSADGIVRRWDAKTGNPIGAPLRGHGTPVWSLAFSPPDGRRLVSASEEGLLRLWNTETWQPIDALRQEDTGLVLSIAFSLDGRRLVSGSDDGKLRVWDGQTGKAIGNPLEGHTGWVGSVAFSSDGLRLVSGSADRTMRMWPGPDAWLDSLCAKLTRNMSKSEWREWVSPDIPYLTQCPGLPVQQDISPDRAGGQKQ